MLLHVSTKKKFKKAGIVAGIATLAIIIDNLLGVSSFVEKLFGANNNSAPIPPKKAIEFNAEEAAIKYRQNSVEKVYKFLDAMNSTKKLTVDNKDLMFNFDEGMALYIYSGSLSKTDIYNLIGNSDVKYADMKAAFESSMLKLRLYYARSTNESGLSELIADEKSRTFFTDYEKLIIEYNKMSPKDRVAQAQKIKNLFKSDFMDGSNLRYEQVQPGVAEAVIQSMIMACQANWRNSTVKFSESDLEAITIANNDKCSARKSSIQELFETLENRQLANLDATDDANSYELLKNNSIDKLVKAEHYSSDPCTIDANNANFYCNVNGEVKVVDNSGKGSGQNTNTTTTKSGSLTPETLQGLPADQKQSAENQIKNNEANLAKQSEESEAKAKHINVEAAYCYQVAENCALSGQPKPSYFVITEDMDEDTKNLRRIINAEIDEGWEHGLSLRKKPPKSNSEIIIDPQYQNEFDGQLLDKNGKPITSSITKNSFVALRDYLTSFQSANQIYNGTSKSYSKTGYNNSYNHKTNYRA